MMGMFGALDTATSGVTVSRVWMDAIADNVANVNVVTRPGEEPFRARYVLAQSRDGLEGVDVAGITLKEGEPALVFDPTHPYADENGNVARAVVDMGEEMTNLVIANRTYQANLAVIDRVRDAYKRALEIGR